MQKVESTKCVVLMDMLDASNKVVLRTGTVVDFIAGASRLRAEREARVTEGDFMGIVRAPDGTQYAVNAIFVGWAKKGMWVYGKDRLTNVLTGSTMKTPKGIPEGCQEGDVVVRKGSKWSNFVPDITAAPVAASLLIADMHSKSA